MQSFFAPVRIRDILTIAVACSGLAVMLLCNNQIGKGDSSASDAHFRFGAPPELNVNRSDVKRLLGLSPLASTADINRILHARALGLGDDVSFDVLNEAYDRAALVENAITEGLNAEQSSDNLKRDLENVNLIRARLFYDLPATATRAQINARAQIVKKKFDRLVELHSHENEHPSLNMAEAVTLSKRHACEFERLNPGGRARVLGLAASATDRQITEAREKRYCSEVARRFNLQDNFTYQQAKALVEGARFEEHRQIILRILKAPTSLSNQEIHKRAHELWSALGSVHVPGRFYPDSTYSDRSPFFIISDWGAEAPFKIVGPQKSRDFDNQCSELHWYPFTRELAPADF